MTDKERNDFDSTIHFWILSRIHGVSASMADNGGPLNLELIKALDRHREDLAPPKVTQTHND
jgi:hypothetical protein